MSAPPNNTGNSEDTPTVTGTQTLMRGLKILELVASGADDIKTISRTLDMPRSTTHRMLASLVREGYLHSIPYHGYSLGYKLIYLGSLAREQRPLLALAQPYLEELAEFTGDTVHLGMREGAEVLYLSKVSGGKGLEMRSRIGQRMPLASTGIGRALMFGLPEEEWHVYYDEAVAMCGNFPERPKLPLWPQYCEALQNYKAQGWVMDLEENEVGIRCVGAPILDVNNEVIAALSVASVIFYMPQERMLELGPKVRETAERISKALGANNNNPEFR